MIGSDRGHDRVRQRPKCVRQRPKCVRQWPKCVQQWPKSVQQWPKSVQMGQKSAKIDQNGLKWPKSGQIVVPDPYHGVVLGSAPCPRTPCTGYHPTRAPCTILPGTLQHHCYRPGHCSPGFFRIQSPGQMTKMSKTTTFLRGQKPGCQNCTFWQN